MTSVAITNVLLLTIIAMNGIAFIAVYGVLMEIRSALGPKGHPGADSVRQMLADVRRQMCVRQKWREGDSGG